MFCLVEPRQELHDIDQLANGHGVTIITHTGRPVLRQKLDLELSVYHETVGVHD